MKEQSNLTTKVCVSCQSVVTGKFCSVCGEKVIDPEKDFRVSKFLEQTIDGFTHLDTKIFASFLALIFKPGVLSKAYIEGRRVAYMKPIQLFFVASLIFYFVFPHSTAYISQSFQLDHGLKNKNRIENLFQYDAMKNLREKADASQKAISDVIAEFHSKAADRSKGFLFLIIPFFAFFLWIFFLKYNRFYVVHLIFALHSFSFFLLWDLLYLNILKFLKFPGMDDVLLMPLIGIFVLYLYLAVRKFYEQKIIFSFLKTIAIVLLFFITIAIYRQFISIWTIETL
jgi:hypothetical protein